MKKYKFEDLKIGNIYTQELHGFFGKFVGMYNDQIAEFVDVVYDEEKGDFVEQTPRMVKRLVERECVFD